MSSAQPQKITAALLVIGDEILSGRTKDKNIGTIADDLTAVGIDLSEVRIVPDVEAEIVAAVNALRSRYTYVFTTGGIGPTHDDITADAIAKAFGVSIDVDERAVAVMRPAYEQRGMHLTPARLRMARIPAGADLIANSVSFAPGFRIGNVIVMAGVPNIMHAMLSEVMPRLEKGARMLARSILLSHPEGEVAELFAEHQRAHPGVMMGSYPSFKDGRYTTELVLRARDEALLVSATDDLRDKLTARSLIFLTQDSA